LLAFLFGQQLGSCLQFPEESAVVPDMCSVGTLATVGAGGGQDLAMHYLAMNDCSQHQKAVSKRLGSRGAVVLGVEDITAKTVKAYNKQLCAFERLLGLFNVSLGVCSWLELGKRCPYGA
jgi:hypothetical protein